MKLQYSVFVMTGHLIKTTVDVTCALVKKVSCFQLLKVLCSAKKAAWYRAFFKGQPHSEHLIVFCKTHTHTLKNKLPSALFWDTQMRWISVSTERTGEKEGKRITAVNGKEISRDREVRDLKE